MKVSDLFPPISLLVLALLVWASAGLPLCAQNVVLTGAIGGRITDQSGAIVPGVSVQLLSAERGTTLLLITHDRELARRCHRTVAMADGRVLDADNGAGLAVLGGRSG